MANYVLSALGIAVSILLFLAGYRQTIGAKKERVAAANAQLERIMLRRIALESHVPDAGGLRRLISGKAMDYRVKPDDLMSTEQLLQIIYTRISESDLIAAERRDEILARLNPVLDLLEAKDVLAVTKSHVRSFSISTETIFLLFGVLSAVIGTVVAGLPGLHAVASGERPIDLVLALRKYEPVFLVSLVSITALYLFIRLRASQLEEVSAKREESSSSDLEAFVLRILNTMQPARVLRAPKNLGIDFVVLSGEKRIGILVKNFRGHSWRLRQRALKEELDNTLKKARLDSIFIVTRGPMEVDSAFKGASPIRVVPADELRLALS